MGSVWCLWSFADSVDPGYKSAAKHVHDRAPSLAGRVGLDGDVATAAANGVMHAERYLPTRYCRAVETRIRAADYRIGMFPYTRKLQQRVAHTLSSFSRTLITSALMKRIPKSENAEDLAPSDRVPCEPDRCRRSKSRLAKRRSRDDAAHRARDRQTVVATDEGIVATSSQRLRGCQDAQATPPPSERRRGSCGSGKLLRPASSGGLGARVQAAKSALARTAREVQQVSRD